MHCEHFVFTPSQWFPLGGLSFSSHFNYHGESCTHLDTPLGLFFTVLALPHFQPPEADDARRVQSGLSGPADPKLATEAWNWKTMTCVTFVSIVSEEAAISGSGRLNIPQPPLSKMHIFSVFSVVKEMENSGISCI